MSCGGNCSGCSCKKDPLDALKEELRTLLEDVPVPPRAITYEHGWELLDRLQSLSLKYKGI